MASSHPTLQAFVLCLCLPVLLAGVLVGPKYKPGDTMTRIDFESVDNALDDVLKAGDILEGRRCAIGVANLGPSDLTSAKWYLESGHIYSSAPLTVEQRTTGLTLFHKKSVAPAGTKGLLSYDIVDTDFKVVILWDVPWSDIRKDIRYAVKIYAKTVSTDKDLYKQMNKYGGLEKSSGWLETEEYGIKVTATINARAFAKLYVSVDSNEYNNEGKPKLNAECDRNAIKIGKLCWQECRPSGYCWVDKKCTSDADCIGPLQCYGACKKT